MPNRGKTAPTGKQKAVSSGPLQHFYACYELQDRWNKEDNADKAHGEDQKIGECQIQKKDGQDGTKHIKIGKDPFSAALDMGYGIQGQGISKQDGSEPQPEQCWVGRAAACIHRDGKSFAGTGFHRRAAKQDPGKEKRQQQIQDTGNVF